MENQYMNLNTYFQILINSQMNLIHLLLGLIVLNL